MAALIAQESTFDPKIRSAANAWGLMQLVPGDRPAPGAEPGSSQLHHRPAHRSRIEHPARHLLLLAPRGAIRRHLLRARQLQRRENRVVRWKERPRLDEDEFIDDIPFPETQNYVKRILGTAEDYGCCMRRARCDPDRHRQQVCRYEPAATTSLPRPRRRRRNPSPPKSPRRRSPQRKLPQRKQPLASSRLGQRTTDNGQRTTKIRGFRRA